MARLGGRQLGATRLHRCARAAHVFFSLHPVASSSCSTARGMLATSSPGRSCSSPHRAAHEGARAAGGGDASAASSRTDELLEKIVQQNNDLKEKVFDIEQQNHEIKQQNNEMKQMFTEFARNPQLIVLVDKLYPIQSLREIDLKTPAFKPVLEILENELPEYANLAQEKTGKVHCKAVRKLNEIQPTTVKDEEKLFCKDGDVITKADNMDTTKEFINVMANSGFEYAQKASVDLKSKRESDQPFLETILKNASCDTIQNLQEIVI